MKNSKITHTILSQNLKFMALAWMMTLAACGAPAEIDSSVFDDARDIASVPVEEPSEQMMAAPLEQPQAQSQASPGFTAVAMKTVTLKEAMNIRTLKNQVLEFTAELPAGTVLGVFDETSSQNYDYRKTDGGVERSSTGFLTPLEVVSVPTSAQKIFTAKRLKEINSAPGGVFISASISGEVYRNQESFAAIAGGQPGAGFLKYFNTSGKPKFNYTTGIKKRFGSRVDQAIPMSSLNASAQTKWLKIYNELKIAGDRTVKSPRDLMIIDSAQAKQLSIRYEKEGFVNSLGAWSVAVEGTATRHGFANVPCAETMSEVIRQAYKRAGYSHLEDFNTTKGNPLIWSKTAAVVELSRSLNVAGWVPWDHSKFRAPAGAIMMHTTGISPGHTYMAGGHDGRLIVDNGTPRGRDLRITSEKILAMMYMTGVFFLPPGIQPQPW